MLAPLGLYRLRMAIKVLAMWPTNILELPYRVDGQVTTKAWDAASAVLVVNFKITRGNVI